MEICQTLWTRKKDLLKDDFGWLSPQHHLMGWALSSLKLSQFYGTLKLYTDTAGRNILIDVLNLPYTQVFDDYENLKYSTRLWALPKLLTYSRQRSTFLHVDGDVFIWKPFSENLMSGELIAQNLEKGTACYRRLFNPIIKELKYIPSNLKRNLISPNMRAYNAGIMGGRDCSFFQSYTERALEIINRNEDRILNESSNIILEQLLFFSMVKAEKKTVSCYFDRIFDDDKYNYFEIANFFDIDKLEYLHLLGKFKRTWVPCDMLAKYLRFENEEIYLRIVNLFKECHYFYNTINIAGSGRKVSQRRSQIFKYNKIKSLINSLNPLVSLKTNKDIREFVKTSGNVIIKEYYSYEKRIHYICTKFQKIDSLSLKQQEDDYINSVRYSVNNDLKGKSVKFYRNSYSEIVYSAFDWTSMQVSDNRQLKIRCSEKKDIPICISPEMYFSGYREVCLDDVGINILLLTEKRSSFLDILGNLKQFFKPKEKNEQTYTIFCDNVYEKLLFLIRNRVLFVSKDES